MVIFVFTSLLLINNNKPERLQWVSPLAPRQKVDEWSISQKNLFCWSVGSIGLLLVYVKINKNKV